MPLQIQPVNLILILCAIAVILSEFELGIFIALIGGILLDFSSGTPDGLITISLLAVFLVLHFLLNEILSREPNRFILFAAVALGTVFYFGAFLAVDRLFGLFNLKSGIDIRQLLTIQLPLMLVFNSLFTYPVLKFYSFVKYVQSLRSQPN